METTTDFVFSFYASQEVVFVFGILVGVILTLLIQFLVKKVKQWAG